MEQICELPANIDGMDGDGLYDQTLPVLWTQWECLDLLPGFAEG